MDEKELSDILAETLGLVRSIYASQCRLQLIAEGSMKAMESDFSLRSEFQNRIIELAEQNLQNRDQVLIWLDATIQKLKG